MKKHFILLSALISLQVSAFSPSNELYKMIKNAYDLFTKMNASMAAQNSNSAPQAPAGSSRQNNSQVAPPEPTFAGSSNYHEVDLKKLEQYLKKEADKIGADLHVNCKKSSFSEECCMQAYEYTNMIKLQIKAKKQSISKNEIDFVEDTMHKKIKNLEHVINESSNQISILEKSYYNEIDGVRVDYANTLKLQHKNNLEELARLRKAHIEIFGYSYQFFS